MLNLVFIFVGVLLLIYQINHNKKINKLKELTSLNLDKSLVYSKFIQKEDVQRVLEKSDVFLTKLKNFDENIFLKIMSAFFVFLVIFSLSKFFSLGLKQSNLGLIGIFAILFFLLVPSFLRKLIIEHRIQKINQDIPMFVDMLAVCIQAGMNIQASIEFLEENISQVNKNFAPFLNRMLLKSQISGMGAAIDDLQKELPSTQVSMMCTTLKQSLKYGSSVYSSLMSLSQEIREYELLQTEEAIGKLSAKMSIPLILFFMFPVIIIIAAPGVMRVLGGF